MWSFGLSLIRHLYGSSGAITEAEHDSKDKTCDISGEDLQQTRFQTFLRFGTTARLPNTKKMGIFAHVNLLELFERS